MRRLLAACVLAGLAFGPAAQAAGAGFVRIDGARFASVLPSAPGTSEATVVPFLLQSLPVTNQQFLEFVTAAPKWRRGAATPLFVDGQYLSHWRGPLDLGDADPAAPVTQVSWFAARAYCESQGARLPTWHEWEWAAAADERRPDARDDPAWRQRILGWYARPATQRLAHVGQSAPNLYGVHDLHGLVWEWVDDYASLLMDADNRAAGDGDLMKFCGTGALTLEQKDNYAVLMRVAMFSSLEARYTTPALGFRCARDPGDGR